MIKQFFLLMLIVCLLGNLVLIYMLYDQISLSDSKFLELDKCPFCYGKSICFDLQFKGTRLNRYNIEFDDSLLNTYFLQSILNIKNVFFAHDSLTGQKMVVKKLAHNFELDEFDDNEKNCMSNENYCFTKAINFYQQNISNKLDEKSFQIISNYLEIDFAKCFSSRLINLMYEGYFKTYSKSVEKVTNFFEDNLAILTILKINPEPIVIQILSKKNGWPFPQYFGSCGRTTFESFEGKTIDQYYNSDFIMRIKIAKRLMETIKKLEYNRLHIGVYLLDLGLENISYDEQNDRIYFIDAENVFLVDKLKIKSDFDVDPLYSDFEECGQFGDCLSFNLDKICKSSKVDINIYSVCRNILSSYASDMNHKNFLHSIPEDVNKIFQLDQLLNECSTNKNKRFEIMEILITSFDRILFFLLKE